MHCWLSLAGIQDANILPAGRVQEAWQRVKEETAWMVPLIKFLLGSASFLVWWAAFRHWLPHMCSSRKQFWRTLRSEHSLYTLMHLLPHMSSSCKQFWRTLRSKHHPACAHFCTCCCQDTAPAQPVHTLALAAGNKHGYQRRLCWSAPAGLLVCCQ